MSLATTIDLRDRPPLSPPARPPMRVHSRTNPLVTTPRVGHDPLTRALAWVESLGIELRVWPSPDPAAAPRDVDRPVLYLVDVDAGPPYCAAHEDWLRAPIDIEELTARADRLVARAAEVQDQAFVIDDDDVLHAGDDLVILSQVEARILRPLIDRMGDLVLRDDLIATVWPDGPPADERALDNRVKCLRQRLGAAPLRIHTVRGRGLLLERLVDGSAG